jgi:hypothetical protein
MDGRMGGGGGGCESDLTSTMIEICWPYPLVGLRVKIFRPEKHEHLLNV